MSRGRSLSRGSRPSRLSPDEVWAVVAAQAARRPLPTVKITDLCEAAYAGQHEVNNDVVYKQLMWLYRKGRIESYSGDDPSDVEQLSKLGAAYDPESHEDRHARYWRLKD